MYFRDLLLLNITVRDVLRDGALTVEVEDHWDLLSWRDRRDGDLGCPVVALRLLRPGLQNSQLYLLSREPGPSSLAIGNI